MACFALENWESPCSHGRQVDEEIERGRRGCPPIQAEPNLVYWKWNHENRNRDRCHGSSVYYDQPSASVGGTLRRWFV